MREVWRGAFVGDDALVSAVAVLRRTLGDDARRSRIVQTVPKRGYRLVAPVSRTEVNIAVLPLLNLSGDAEQEYLADGMTDALISALGRRRRGLRVISRTSSMCLKGSDESLPEIARALGADVVVEGSVLCRDQLIRISAQLVDAETDHQLMGRVYERDLSDVLALQSELAYDLDGAIRAALGDATAIERVEAQVVNSRSFLEYLRGRHRSHQLMTELLGQRLEHFERARELDPDSPHPHLGIVDVWGWRAVWGVVSPEVARREIADSLTKLAEHGEELAEAQALLGKAAQYFDRDWDAAEHRFRRALDLNPSDVTALWSYGLLAIARGRLEDGAALAARANERDPLNPAPRVVLGVASALGGDLSKGLSHVERAREQAPLPPCLLGSWGILSVLGRRGEVLGVASAFFSAVGREEIASILKPSGQDDADPDAAMVRAAEVLVRQRREGYRQPTQIARLFLGGGDEERALEWLRIAVSEQDPALVYLAWPEWNRLRSRQAFRDLLESIALSA